MAGLRAQRGNTFVGFILGLVVGLAVALVVAIYVTKVPIPFLDKGLSRNAEQDAAEEKKNKDWDPNAPLYGKNPSANAPVKSDEPAPGKTVALPPTDPSPASTSDDPLGDLAASKARGDEFQYFIQVGAFHSSEDAEGQRAKLSLGGYDPKISERDQAGKMVYRVRLGPFDSKSEAEQIQTKLKSNKFESALIRVQR
ncbi:MAG: sporulation protein [Betaproteobacteria bacterium]|nr:sporulation protein [Betaproteobacteria bacterium]